MAEEGQEIKALGEENKAAGEENEAADEENKAAGEENEAEGQGNEVEGRENKAAGDENIVAGQENEAERRYPRRIRKSVVREEIAQPRPKPAQKPSKDDQTQSVQKPFKASWKPEDQEKFDHTLQTFGDQDVALLTSKTAQKVTNSSAVYNYLQRHKKFVAPKNVDVRLPRHQRLQKWVDAIRDKKVKRPQPNPTALSMLLISLLEDHPVPTDDEVNFTEAYEFMFELLSGRNFSRQKKCVEGTYSEPTLKFIRLTVLSLLKETASKLYVLHDKFVNSANDEVPVAKKDLRGLPDHVQQLLVTGHFNPLELNEDALTIDPPTAAVVPCTEPSGVASTAGTSAPTPNAPVDSSNTSSTSPASRTVDSSLNQYI